MGLEDIFIEIGGFSKFQVLMIASVYTMKFMTGWSMMQMLFAGLIPDYYCVTQLDSTPSQSMDSDGQGLNPQSQYGNETLNVCSVNGTSCADFIFQGSARTVISEWNLVCDLKWIKAFVTSLQMGGVLIGAVLAGQCGDYFGRKKTTYGFYFVHALLNVVAAFSVSWQMFTVLRFFIGIGIGAMLVVVVPYPAEFLPLRWRLLIPVIPMWPFGVMFFAGAAYVLEDWSHLHLACAAFCVPGLLGFFYIPESVRWLTVQNRLKDAYAVLEKMANVNGKTLPSNTMELLEKIAEEERESRVSGQRYSYLDVIRGKKMIKTTLIFAFKWASLSVVFYGLSFGVSSFAGNIYLNIFLMAGIEIPANTTVIYLANKIGRRWTCLGYLALGCVTALGCLVAHLLAPEDQRGIIISGLSLTAKMAVGACWVASQIWVVENYPTVTRSLGYGVANMAARVGGILAPYAVNLDDMVVFSYIMIGALQLASLLLVLLLPETKDSTLPETLAQSSGFELEVKSNGLQNGSKGHDIEVKSNDLQNGSKGHDLEAKSIDLQNGSKGHDLDVKANDLENGSKGHDSTTAGKLNN